MRRVLSLTLLLELPERGRLSWRQLAKLVVVAPLSRDSRHAAQVSLRPRKPRRFPRGTLDGALVATKRDAVIRAFYQRILAAGNR